MSVQGALESIVLKFISPYIEGVNLAKLRTGIWAGQVDIESVRVKPEVLALFGLEGFRIATGEVGAIRVRVPWHSLYTGRISVEVEGVHVHVEQVADKRSDRELIKAMRESKEQAIEVSQAQLRDWYRHKKQAQEAMARGQEVVDAGLLMKVARKFVNNISVRVAEVAVAFSSKELGLACDGAVRELAVLSTDGAFQDAPSPQEAIDTSALYKVARVSGLCLQLAAGATGSDEYVVRPSEISVQFAHVPEKQLLQLRVNLGTDGLNHFTILRSQVQHLFLACSAIEEQQARLRALLAPPEVERAILTVEDASKQEYARLYGHKLLQGMQAIKLEEAARLQLLEDVLPTQTLAAQRCAAEDAVERSRLTSARGFAGGWTEWLFGPCLGGCACIQTSPSLDAEDILADLKAGAVFEELAAPTKVDLKVALGGARLNVIDDRHDPGDPSRELLSLALHETKWSILVEGATDHRGNSSARLRVEGFLGAVGAQHAGQPVIQYQQAGASSSSLNTCARLLLEQTLEEDHNLLSLEFELAAVSVYLYPSLLKQILDFPQPAPASSPPAVAPTARPAGGRAADQSDPAEIAMQYLGANKQKALEVANQLTEEVSKRIPDRLRLKVVIHAPTLHAPVPGVGSTAVSLGLLQLCTPEPCPLNALNLTLDLTETVLRAQTFRGEVFDVVNPVPVNVSLVQQETDEAISVHVAASVGEMVLSVWPQALQVLVSVADALEKELATLERPAPPKAASTASLDGDDPDEKELMFELAQEVFSGAAADAARRRVDEVSRKKLLVIVEARMEKFLITVTDSIVPVIKVNMSLYPPGAVVNHEGLVSGQAIATAVDVKDVGFRVEVLNPRTGVWEPLLEEFRLGLAVRATPTEQGGVATQVSCVGQQPLLLNVQPSAVRRLVGLGPLFEANLKPIAARAGEAPSDAAGGRYRVINLSQEVLQVEAAAQGGREIVSRDVVPTGSDHISLDSWILRHGVTELRVRAKGGDQPSAPLSLEHCGAVGVPGSPLVAEFLTPGEGHRLLLLGMPLKVHNKTALPLEVRFHDKRGAVQPVDAEQPVGAAARSAVSVCEAAVLGLKLPDHEVCTAYSPGKEPAELHAILLPPNSVCSVPPSVHVSAPGGAAAGACSWLSVKPVGIGMDFSAPVEVGFGVPQGVLRCSERRPGAQRLAADLVVAKTSSKSSEGQRNPDPSKRRRHCGCGTGSPDVADPEPVGSASHFHLRYDLQSYKCYLPDPLAPVELATISLLPALTVLNALPFGSLGFRWSPAARAWREVTVPHLAAFQFFDVPAQDVHVSARLEDGAPWSQSVPVTERGLQEGATKHPLEVRQKIDGAAAGAVLEASAPFHLRLSCPFWFAERAGLGGGATLEVWRSGAPLPKGAGVTLLPSDCFDHSCELVLRGGALVDPATRSLRMPPNFSTLHWKTPIGPLALCVQCEDVAPAGLLGASCKVLTLRPRLVLTNASSEALELRLPTDAEATRGVAALVSRFVAGASRALTNRSGLGSANGLQLVEDEAIFLAAGEVRELHFDIGQGKHEGELLATRLCFRPAAAGGADEGPAAAWSGPVTCSEEDAGSAAYMRPAVGDNRPEVWSVDIAPGRGAMAVTFRQASEFVAVNRMRKVQLAVRPVTEGCDVAEIPVPRGAEVPFGWVQPQCKGFSREVQVIVNDQVCAVLDVGRSTRKVIQVAQPARRTMRRHGADLSGDQLGGAAPSRPRRRGQRGGRDQEGDKDGSQGGLWLAVSVSRVGQKTILALEQAEEAQQGGSTLQVEVKLSQIGVSLMQELPVPQELLFFAVDLIRLDFHQSSEADSEHLRLLVSDIQAACQLPGRAEGRRRANRGLMQIERRAVVLAETHKDESADFLDVSIRRDAASSRDLVIKGMDIKLNGLEVAIDSEWLDPLVQVLGQIGGEVVQELGTPLEHVVRTAGRPIAEGFSPPPLPAVMHAEGISISAVDLAVWCSLPIRMLDFLPAYARAALALMCMGGEFTLDGARLQLPAKVVPESRGSVEDFAVGLGSEYSLAILGNVAGLLGKSSLLNLPALPIKLGGGAVSLVTDGLGVATTEVASRLLAFDEEYAARQRQAQQNKEINHAGAGLLEAGRSLATGVEGIFDIVRKPVEGARERGFKGFAIGVGQGLAGAVVKPIAGVASAVADIGAGLAATAGADVLKRRMHRHERWRQPRLLFDVLGEVRPFAALDAEVLRQLGRNSVLGVREVLPLALEGARCAALLLFRTRAVVAEVALPASVARELAVTSGKSTWTLATASTETDSHEEVQDEGPSPFFEALFGSAFTPALGGRARELRLADVLSASEGEGHALLLADKSGSHRVPLSAASMGRAAVDALLEGFREAMASGRGETNWAALRHALVEEHSESGLVAREASAARRAGERVLEVVEVQRRRRATGGWGVSNLPTEKHSFGWRWVDGKGRRHPSLRAGASREEAAAAEEPPCELDDRFKPHTGWEVQVTEGTDPNGWVYSMAWYSSTWESKPSLVDNIRKRRWCRVYV